jgi:hypothetical protein
VQPLERTDRAGAHCELHPPVELLGVREPGLGEDDGELVAADAAGDVGTSDDRLEALGDSGEDRVPREVADAVVDRLEVVDVEDDEGKLAMVAVGTRAFADEVSWK